MSRMCLAGLTACLLLAGTADAATSHRVDDSGTVVEDRSVTMKWREPVPQRGTPDMQVSGALVVRARLNLAPWRGRTGRIYLMLPPGPAAPVTAQWTTRGRLLPGVVRPGERALVYAGPIVADTLEDTLQLVLQADGRHLLRSEQLNFVFEIDLETP